MVKHYRLLVRALFLVALLLCAKYAIHLFGLEVLTINILFSGLVASNVFVMGFLLSGVLADYKESERIPGEIATSLESLAQDLRGIQIAKPEAPVTPALAQVLQTGKMFYAWFHKKEALATVFQHLDDLTRMFAHLEPYTSAPLIMRLKLEQTTLRRILIRVHTIRETSFIKAGYLLADLITFLICTGLLFAKIEPFYESLFYVAIIACFMIYILLLIRDLDNPFDYDDATSCEDVSLQPLKETLTRLEQA